MSAHEVALLSLEEIRTGRNPWPLITETKRCRSRWDWVGACGSCTPMHHSNDGSGAPQSCGTSRRPLGLTGWLLRAMDGLTKRVWLEV